MYHFRIKLLVKGFASNKKFIETNKLTNNTNTTLVVFRLYQGAYNPTGNRAFFGVKTLHETFADGLLEGFSWHSGMTR